MHWAEYKKALTEKDALAADFHINSLVKYYTEFLAAARRDARALLGRGDALYEKKDVDGAIAKYRQAIEVEPALVEAHKKLAVALADKDDVEGAIAASRRALALGPWDTTLSFLTRNLKSRQWFLLAARFNAEAFSAYPRLTESVYVQNRYNAACYAALVGAGEGKDADNLDESERARWRRQALDWLKADLALCRKIALTREGYVSPQSRLQHWQTDPNLAGIRGAAMGGKPGFTRRRKRGMAAILERCGPLP